MSETACYAYFDGVTVPSQRGKEEEKWGQTRDLAPLQWDPYFILRRPFLLFEAASYSVLERPLI